MKRLIIVVIATILLLGGTIAVFSHHTPQDTKCTCGCGYTLDKCPC